MRRWFVRAVLVAVCLSLGAPVHAQQEAMAELYGQAVHQYFAGNYAGAELLLNEVQASVSEDPRVHYFLGMCKVAQGGGPTAGIADFEAGAQAEVRSKNSFQVGIALTRIQGAARREIEKARLPHVPNTANSNCSSNERERKLPLRASQLLRLLPTVPPAGGDTAPANVPDPLTEGLRSDATTVDPVQPTTPDTSNPFGDDPVTPATPNTPATDTPTAPADGNPFGAPAAEPMSDPFGTGN